MMDESRSESTSHSETDENIKPEEESDSYFHKRVIFYQFKIFSTETFLLNDFSLP